MSGSGRVAPVLRVANPEVGVVDDTLEVSASVTWDAPPEGVPAAGERIVQRLHGVGALVDGGTPPRLATGCSEVTALLPTLTLLATAAGHDLVVDGPLDARAVSGAEAAARLLGDWYDWRAASVSVSVSDLRSESSEPAAGVGLFFSRGLDSMAEAVMARGGERPVTHYIGLDWVDLPYEGPPQRDIWHGTEQAAREADIPLLRVTTNARAFIDPVVHWSRAHGATLAGGALVLDGVVGSVGVSSSFTKGEDVAHGTHAQLDGLWSSSSVRIEHRHGVAGGRVAKGTVVRDDPWVARWLKSCWARPGDGNCGACRKCLMTMGALWLAGADRIVDARFEGELTPEAIRAAIPGPPILSPAVYAEHLADLVAVAHGEPFPGTGRSARRRQRRWAADLASAWDELLRVAVPSRSPDV